MNSISFKDNVNWRYATKAMDATNPVPQEKLDVVLEAIRMAPTSSGTQPFEVFVVSNPEIRQEIRAVGYDQQPITDSSYLLVFAAWDNYTAERIDAVSAHNKELRGDLPMIDKYYEILKGMYLPRDPQVNFEHAARQCYIALGFALLAAAEEKVDSTPMEGFDPDSVDKILGLREKGLRSAVIMTIGYRDAEKDWLVNMPKVRKSKDELFTFLA